tara:strand:+ start:322 stop:945 length:624 start_codon:yes stop_codon:yes gene_type:complete
MDKIGPGQSRTETPEEAGHSPIQDETATKWWKSLGSKPPAPKALEGLRTRAATAATPKPEAEKPTMSFPPIDHALIDKWIQGVEDRKWRRGRTLTPEEAEAQQDTTDDAQDHMDWAKERFPDGEGGALFGAERIESVATGQKWPPEQRDRAHGWRNELGPDYEIVEVTEGGDIIYEGPDGGQESVNQSTGEWVTLGEGEKAPTWRDL